MSCSRLSANAQGGNMRCITVRKTSLKRLVQNRALCEIPCPKWAACVCNKLGSWFAEGADEAGYGLICSVALTGKAEFAQLLFVSGCLLCMAAMVAALLSPTFGHPQVPREQHLFPEPLCGDQPRRTLPIGAGSSLHVAGVSATPSA